MVLLEEAHDNLKRDENEALKIQYVKLAEDWRQFNTILWGIPTVAVSIMAGIIVVAYQSALPDIPRFVSLVIGALFLFALTIEVIKKRVHMNVISDILKQLQGPNGLKLKGDFNFPVGLSTDVEDYWDKKRNRLETSEVGEPEGDWLFDLFRRSLARKFLAYVTFFSAIAVAILAIIELVKMILQLN